MNDLFVTFFSFEWYEHLVRYEGRAPAPFFTTAKEEGCELKRKREKGGIRASAAGRRRGTAARCTLHRSQILAWRKYGRKIFIITAYLTSDPDEHMLCCRRKINPFTDEASISSCKFHEMKRDCFSLTHSCPLTSCFLNPRSFPISRGQGRERGKAILELVLE